MARLGPFENEPRLAVAVSGGRDSMALVLLAADWAAARGGRVDAVTVDHGLRDESAAEARQVGRWLRRASIPHHILRWTPGETLRGVEAAARTARYALLEEFCRTHGVLHLLVGHHSADQAETREMRRIRASGPVGLAGMPAVRELSHARILRPLLGFPRERVTETLAWRNQSWIEDPSNRDPRFARARLRAGPDRDADSAPDSAAGAARVRADLTLARLAARAVLVHPAGFATVDVSALRDSPDGLARRLVGNVVSCVSGRIYPPRGERLARLVGRVVDDALGTGATLAGCVVRPHGAGRVMVAREFAAVAPPVAMLGEPLIWDDRFAVMPSGDRTDGMLVGAVGHFASRDTVERPGSDALAGIPPEVRNTMPAVMRNGEMCLCGPLGARKPGSEAVFARFSPKMPVAGARFATD